MLHYNQDGILVSGFMEHLGELRNRLIRIFLVLAVAVAGCFYFSEPILQFLIRPLQFALGNDIKITFWAPHEAFFAYMNLAVYSGLGVALPFILLQIWGFVAPGLYQQEQKVFLPFLCAVPLMFGLGVMLAYHVVIPVALEFFASFQGNFGVGQAQIVQETRLNEYLEFIIGFLLVFGVAFQMPVALTLLGIMGLIQVQTLKMARKYVLVAVALLSAFFTPPDIFSMLGLAVPLYALYEISIILISWFAKPSNSE